MGHHMPPAQHAPIQEVKIKTDNSYYNDELTQNYNDNINDVDNVNNVYSENRNDIHIAPHIEDNSYIDASTKVKNVDNSNVESKSKANAEGGAGGNSTVIDLSTLSNEVGGSVSNSSTVLNLNQPITNQDIDFTPAYTTVGGVSLPGTSLFGVVTGTTRSGFSDDLSATIGIQHTFSGRSRKLAQQRIVQETLINQVNLCKSLVGYEIDYSAMPEMPDCSFISQKVVIDKTADYELKLLKLKIKEQKALLKKMQDNNAYQRVSIEKKFGVPVQVGE